MDDTLIAQPAAPSSAVRQVLGACPHDCPDTCALVTTVADGRALKLQGNPLHLPTAGVLCPKVARYTERTYHPDRLLQPLRRAGPKGSGRFEPVSWDSALSDIAARLGAIAARDPEAILPYSYCGTMGWCRARAWRGACSIGSAPRCSIAPSAPRPVPRPWCRPWAPRSA